MEDEGDGDTNCNWRTRYNHQRIGKGTGGIENKRETIQLIVLLRSARKLGSPGNLKRLGVTQSPVKNYQLTLV